jgi:cation diffusion facilitator family transporter
MTSAASMVTAEREKNSAALSSVLAAVALTTFKIVVGLMTNSLGILAEAAHSGLDLVAALVTWFAVRTSGKPADVEHHYGHGKIENLSALFEAFLLLVTCVWIIYESIQRLFFKAEEVEVSFWAFLVMAISILIDYSRSRVLERAARKHNSQALEADALHFKTDIWSSSVVIVGLIAVKLADWLPGLPILAKADAVAALGVALIVIYVSIELGVRTIHGLLDQAPKGLAEEIEKAVEAIPGVLDCHQVRASCRPRFIHRHLMSSLSSSVFKGSP